MLVNVYFETIKRVLMSKLFQIYVYVKHFNTENAKVNAGTDTSKMFRMFGVVNTD